MDLEQLRQMEAIGRTGSVTAAARELLISQPALSRSVRRLERELGRDLFVRTKNSMSLNPAGQRVLEFAQSTLRGERILRDELDDLDNRERTVRIGTVAPAPLWRLTDTIVRKAPGTVLAPRMMGEEELERALLNRDVDLGIALRPLTFPDMRSAHLMDEALKAHLPTSHPLASRESVTFEELDGLTFMIFRDIGFWWGVCRHAMPRSEFLVQEDRNVFMQMVASSDVPSFATDQATGGQVAGRIAVPIANLAATASFYVVGPEDSPHLDLM